jgi:hypothetical protein
MPQPNDVPSEVEGQKVALKTFFDFWTIPKKSGIENVF